jgi:hypothetical protein
VEDRGLTECLGQDRVRAGALVTWDVEAAWVPRDIRDDGIEVRGFGLVGDGADAIGRRWWSTVSPSVAATSGRPLQVASGFALRS